MLVLVSFGLVLLATIALIVGLFNDTLGLIYLSIVASVVAGIVLYLAFRMARPKTEKGREAPEPIDPDGVEADHTTVQPAVVADDEVDADVSDDVAVEAAEDVPVAAAAVPDDDWMDDEQWDDEVVDFPIADYDDLTVAEVMPLLPQLYSDELDLVIDRERSGRNRSTIIRRLEDLKVSGTEADEEASDDTGPAVGAGVSPVGAGAAASAAAAAGTPASASVFEADDDDEDFFPIADYDDLTVGQIMPLLGQLEVDELEDVRSREAAGAGRKTLLAEIERRISGDVEEPAPAPAPIPAKAKPRPAKKAARKAPATKAAKPTKKATKKKAAAKKAAGKPRFPIANYDELTVADIRPRLADLSPRQLELVRDREASGAGRKTILNDIDSRLD